MTFGEKLRALRKARGQTQSEAAALFSRIFPTIRMTQAKWCQLESRNERPREQILNCLAILFGVHPDDLMPPPPQQPWRDNGTLDQLVRDALQEMES